MRLPKNFLSWITEFIFLLLCVLMCCIVSGEHPHVQLHALIPSHFHWSQSFQRVLVSKLMSYRRDSRYRGLFRAINLHTNVTFLKKDDPKEILNSFCDYVFPYNTTAIIHVNNPLSFRRRTAASQYVLEIASYFGIPVISWDPEYPGSLHTMQEARTLQIAPTIQHQTQAMLKLLTRYNWTDFAVVTSEVAGHQDFIASIRSFVKRTHDAPEFTADGKRPVRFKILKEITLRNKPSQVQAEAQLSQLFESDARVILLHSNTLESKNIMDYARNLGLTTVDYVWILTQTAIPTSRYASRSYHLGMLGITYDHQKDAMETAIKAAVTVWVTGMRDMVNKRMIQKVDLHPKINCQDGGRMFWNDGEIIYNFMKNITVTRPPIISFNSSGVLKFTELKIVNLQVRGTGRKWIEVGKWTKEGLVMQDITWPGEAASPPAGKPDRPFVRIATLKEEPYVMYGEPNGDGKCQLGAVRCDIFNRDEKKRKLTNTTVEKCCNGLSIDLLIDLSQQLDFDYHLFEVDDGQWGAINSVTGEWNGLIKALTDQKADMVITSLKITPERNSAVDFSVPFLETGITIIVSIREGAISPTAFLEPYDYPSWCLILVFSVHATGASIFIFEWLSPYGLNQGLTTMRDHRFSLFRSFWLIWAMLFSAAVSTDTPRGVSSRFLANLWALFALVFLASYTANLAAFMITKEEYYDLSGIQDWRLKNPQAMKPPFKYATIPNGSTETNIKNNHKDIYNYMRKFNLPTVDEGIKALKKQDIHAFIYDATVLEYYAGKDEECRLITVGKSWYAMTGYGVAFPKGSHWINKVNKVLLDLQEGGEMERLQKFWLAGACQKKEKTGVSSHTLGILNFTSAFILLAGGMVLGAILLMLEHCYFRFGRKSLKKWDTCGCCTLVSLSMGKSLTFEASVIEAINLHRRTKCTDPVCETQLWKIKHELDLALLKIDNLQNNIGARTDTSIEDGNSHWRYNPDRPRQPNGIPGQNARHRDRDNFDPTQALGERLTCYGSEDGRSDGGGSPNGRAQFRRSPSYTTAMSENENLEIQALSNRVRYHDGKCYMGVNDTESVF
ncbi:glutamate receptor ionotropic, NMDA 2A-like isoform X2 [Haliotis rufescens]|uniref:glutamate receptor ionotropic, NMDA 2A-like isoform X2 n=1 Tax=Haliotis rufescens TaxID=6454 RepID=UPI001EB02881|nr:glutamate receptor ionotropic, NMDA 2A-like isoform X2 [Haliotis rufescens]